jgi:Methyltransferase FkbM domain
VNPVEVESTTLDAMLDELGPPDFIKIDVEGAELAVLSGGRRTIAEARPVLMFEARDENGQDSAYQSEINRLLLADGYESSSTSGPCFRSGDLCSIRLLCQTRKSWLCMPCVQYTVHQP